MKNQLLLCLLCFSFLAKGQFLNSNFNDLETADCPWNDTITILQPDHWTLYQTTDGTWDGPIDSTRCIEVIDSPNWGMDIDLSQIDPNRPLFVRYIGIGPLFQIPITENALYNTGVFIKPLAETGLNQNLDCENGLCTGLIVGIQVPDETGDSTNLRIYNIPSTPTGNTDYIECIPTENFPNENYLKEFIYKISVDTSSIPNEDFLISIGGAFLEHQFSVNWITSIFIDEGFWDGASYNADIWQIPGFSDNNLVIYQGSEYPSADNPFFLEPELGYNPSEQVDININIAGAKLQFQPFAHIRSGLVAGSDSLRHNLNLINNGNYCTSFIELIFDENTNYVHGTGTVDFNDQSSCFQFRSGSKLKVANGESFHYAYDGIGALLLRSGSQIELGKNSKFYFNGTLFLRQDEATTKEEISITLNPGNILEFEENARLFADEITPGGASLNIYMNGGTLIADHLSAEERSHLNLIYPPVSPTINENFELSPNPVQNDLQISYTSRHSANIQVQITDALGKNWDMQLFEAEKGINNWTISTQKLPDGIYYLTVHEKATKVFLVMH